MVGHRRFSVRRARLSGLLRAELVAAGVFRQDLYFRLCGFELEVPPLRERPDDIPALAEFFAAKHIEALGKRILGISAGVLDRLEAFAFPATCASWRPRSAAWSR